MINSKNRLKAPESIDIGASLDATTTTLLSIMTDSLETKGIYLEDVDTKFTKKSSEPNGSNTTSCSNAGNKRQRSIADMFGGGALSSSTAQKSEPAAKRMKASVFDSTSLKIGSAGTQDLKLNAIPFSLSQYQETLSDEERKLLALECACMGKSWYSPN